MFGGAYPWAEHLEGEGRRIKVIFVYMAHHVENKFGGAYPWAERLEGEGRRVSSSRSSLFTWQV